MKILFTTDSIQRGGKERQLFVLSRWLIDRGHNIDIMALTKGDDHYLKEYYFPCDHLHLVSSKSILKKARECRRLYQILKPDLVFAWDMRTALVGLLSYRHFRFVFINGSIRHGIRLQKPSHLLRSLICIISPAVVANSQAGLRANGLKPGKSHFVLYNGIEEKFRKSITSSEIENKRANIFRNYKKAPGRIFISVANFVPYKDYITVLRALNNYAKSEYFYYLILGEGPMRDDIERKISECGLDGRVMLAGRIENVVDYLQLSDCLIHSSRGEGVSNAILEAMYAGLPIIATNVGGIPETVFPASSMLFPYKDHKALYRCLLKLPELKASFNPAADDYQQHLEMFSVEKMVAGFGEIVQDIISDRSPLA